MIKLKSLLNEVGKKLRQIDTPEFKQWFGHSKAVDKSGNPLILYHGTSSPPSKFSTTRIGHSSNIFGSWEIKRHGIFVTENPDFAETFAKTGKSPTIMPLYIQAENPLDLRKGLSESLFNTIESIVNEMGKNGFAFARFVDKYSGTSRIWALFDEDEGADPETLITVIKKMNYDSVIIDDQSDSDISNTKTWILFDPNQVKSAIGNIGTFDSSDDITKESLL